MTSPPNPSQLFATTRRTIPIIAALIAASVLCVTLSVGAVASEPATIATQGDATATAGETATISLNLTNTGSNSENYIVDVTIPTGWSVDTHTTDGGQWNSGDRQWLWQDIDAGGAVTPSITVSIPEDASAGDYSIDVAAKTADGTVDTTSHTVTVTSPTDNDDTEDESDDGDSSSSGGGGGGGVAGSGDENGDDDETNTDQSTGEDESETSAEASVEQVVSQVAETTPETETQVEIEDTGANEEGVTINTEQTATVDQITLNDESVSGTIEITEYTEPPAEVKKQVTDSIRAALTAGDGESSAGDSGEDATQDADTDANSESPTGDTGENTDDRSENDVELVSMTDITPSSDSAKDTSATVTITVDTTDVDDPSNVVVIHETGQAWERLPTTVEERSSEEITVAAQTDSFSLFAVVESTSVQQSETNPDRENAPPEQNESAPVALIIGGLAGIILVSGVIMWFR